jgi:integrase
MANRINFTKATIEALPPAPPNKQTTYYDQRTPGLIVLVTPAGAKTFYVYRKVKGTPERIKIGRWPELSIEQIRKRAEEIIGQIATGRDPMAERRQLRNDPTLGELFGWYLEHHAKVRKLTWKEDVERFKNHLSHWSNRKISTISRGDVRDLHAKIGRTVGRVAANHTLALVSVIFNKAIAHEKVTVGNPASGIEKFPIASRDRRLMPAELEPFLRAVIAEPNRAIRDFVLLCLFTGARRSNVLPMRWDQIDFAGPIWRIPHTKNGTPQTLPLHPLAVEVLRERLEATADRTGFVFPGPGRHGHLAEPRKGWERICAEAGTPDLHIHDLRRSLGSLAADAGESLHVIGQMLHHQNVQTTAVYARLRLDPVRNAQDKALASVVELWSRLHDQSET